jgi:cation transport regulator ChaB
LREVLATREKDRDRRVLDYVKAGVAHYSAQQKVEEEMRKESDEALKAL